MSTAEILEAIPKLSPPELKAIRRKLQELADKNEDVALCDETALAGARMLDRMEAVDGQLP